MNIYQFTNKLNNRQKPWKRHFVAFSLSDAIEMAKEWCKVVNEANGYNSDLLLTFDYENVTVIQTNTKYDIGYMEYDKSYKH